MPTYTYVSVDRVSPATGTTFGGTAVTITGFGFSLATTVTFGGVAATQIVYESNTTITCVTPLHASGAVTVAVVGVGELAAGYTYVVPVNLLPPYPYYAPITQSGASPDQLVSPAWANWWNVVKTRIESLPGSVAAESIIGVLSPSTIPQLPSSRITMNSPRLLGRSTAGSGNSEEIQVGPMFVLSGGVLSLKGIPGALTQGSVVFAGSGGILSQDNAQFFWDDTNHRLGLGTATPARTLDVVGTMATTGASMGLLGTAGSESLFVFNSTSGATTFAAKTDGTLTLNGLNSFSTSIGLSINMAAGGAWTPMVVTSSGGSAGDTFVISASGKVGIGKSAPAALLSIVGAGATPSSLTGSPLQATVNQAAFGAPTVARFENTSTNAATGFALDVLCGDTGGSFLFGRFTASSPSAADPTFKMGSGSAHDLVLTAAGGEVFRFKQAALFASFGGTTASFPASKRETVNWSFRLGDDSAYTGIIASKLFAGGTNVWWQNLGTTKLQALNGSGSAALDTGPIQMNCNDILTNKGLYFTGTMTSGTPFALYMDVSLAAVSGSGAHAMYLTPSFTLAGNSDVTVFTIPAATVTLAGHTSTNATSLKIENTPTNGTNKRSLWIAAGLSQFDGAVRATVLGAFAAGDKYVIVDASGNLHVSALGPAS